jgi:hypothetical protein
MDRYGIGPQRLGLIAAPGGIHEHPSLDPNSLLATEITGIFDAGDEREPAAPPFLGWQNRKECFPSLGIDTALAAIPARYALDRGQWWEAAHLPVRDSQFPTAVTPI